MKGDMEGIFDRTRILLGEEAMEKLKRAHVAVFGIGGVGGHAAEALCRSGVGTLTLVDNDIVSVSNINRQLFATQSTVGRKKIDVAKERLLDINPECTIHTFDTFLLPGKEEEFPFESYSYMVDAIDTVSGKLLLAEISSNLGIPLISSMGAGNKLDPTRFRVSDIFSTSTDPLSRVMRRELKKRGIKKLKVVWSDEKPLEVKERLEVPSSSSRRAIPGSTAFVPSVAGLTIAAEVVKDIVREEE